MDNFLNSIMASQSSFIALQNGREARGGLKGSFDGFLFEVAKSLCQLFVLGLDGRNLIKY